MFKHDTKPGFTLVELLIVIVVIAILAAISIVSYNGIQQRAKNAAVIDSAQAWLKVLQLSYTMNGTIEIPAPAGIYGLCLGHATDYPASNGLGAGECMDSPTYTNTDLMAEIDKIADVSTAVFDNDSGIERGLQYAAWSDGSGARMYFILFGTDQDCGPSATHDKNIRSRYSECVVDVHEVIGGVPFVY